MAEPVKTKYNDIQRANPSTNKPAEPSNTKKKRRDRVVERNEPTIGDQIVDNVKNLDKGKIRKRLVFDWLFPEIIATIDDILRMILLGNNNAGKRRRDKNGYTHYSTGINDDDRGRNREDLRKEENDPTRQNFRRIRLEFYNREDAEDVIADLREELEENTAGFVTVKELYSLAELPTYSTMYKWGWFDLEEATIERVGDNYVLEMPRAEVIRQ